MVKSEERTTEYCVVVMPRYREHPPICFKGYAKDEEEAASVVFNSDWHKEVLDVKISNKVNWDSNTIKEYWKEYGKPTDNIDIEDIKVKLF